MMASTTKIPTTDAHHDLGPPHHAGGNITYFGGLRCGKELDAKLVPDANHVYEGDVPFCDIDKLISGTGKISVDDTPVIVASFNKLVINGEYLVLGAAVKVLSHPKTGDRIPYPIVMIHQAVLRNGPSLDKVPGSLSVDGVVDKGPVRVAAKDGSLTNIVKVVLAYAPKAKSSHTKNELAHEVTYFLHDKLTKNAQQEVWMSPGQPMSIAGPLVVDSQLSATGDVLSTSWGLFHSNYMPNPLPSGATKHHQFEIETPDTSNQSNETATGRPTKRVHIQL